MIKILSQRYTSESNYFFALLRFIGAGFSAPDHDSVVKLLKTIDGLSSDRYARNITKLVKYVGGEDRVRGIVTDLGVDNLDIFDE